MAIEGGCYCGAVRYATEGDAMMKAQCFCRECQYISGGSQVLIYVVPDAAFSWTKGEAKPFQRADLDARLGAERGRAVAPPEARRPRRGRRAPGRRGAA